jgi:hypothetical protein
LFSYRLDETLLRAAFKASGCHGRGSKAAEAIASPPAPKRLERKGKSKKEHAKRQKRNVVRSIAYQWIAVRGRRGARALHFLFYFFRTSFELPA